MTEMSAAEAATVRRFENAEPAPESWGGLRSALAIELGHHTDLVGDPDYDVADAVLALPEVAALRAKAAAADRVRELAEELDRQAPEQEAWDGNVDAAYTDIADRIRRALDGPPC